MKNNIAIIEAQIDVIFEDLKDKLSKEVDVMEAKSPFDLIDRLGVLAEFGLEQWVKEGHQGVYNYYLEKTLETSKKIEKIIELKDLMKQFKEKLNQL